VPIFVDRGAPLALERTTGPPTSHWHARARDVCRRQESVDRKQEVEVKPAKMRVFDVLVMSSIDFDFDVARLSIM
jgi:hypothetical protein